jgi:hypothetical protein
MSLINFFNLCYILKNGQNFLFPTIYKIYVGKNAFFDSLLTSGHDVSLLLRPRRFGKLFPGP